MKVRPMGKKKKVRLLRTRVLRVCLFTGLFAIAMAVRPGVRAGFAQAAGAQAEAPPAAADAANGAGTQAAQPDQAVKREVSGASADPRKKQIADDTANLMKLATSLKSEVDKITPETMSVSVIREAEEIEKLAHKMRTK